MTAEQKKTFKPYATAGGIILDPRTKRILLVRRKDLNTLQVPKGHQEPHETLEQAALREVREETGYLHLKLIRKLDTTFFYWQDETTRYRATLHIFWLELVDRAIKPGVKRDVRGGEFANTWIPLAQAHKIVSYKNLQRSIRNLQRFVLGKRYGRRPNRRPNKNGKPETPSGTARGTAPRRPASPAPEKRLPRSR